MLCEFGLKTPIHSRTPLITEVLGVKIWVNVNVLQFYRYRNAIA